MSLTTESVAQSGHPGSGQKDIARDRGVRRVVRWTYTFHMCFGLLVWVPVFYSYQKISGLSDAEIFGIQSMYYIAFCLFEIPTGIIADRFDYRWSLASGAGVLIVANLVPIAEPSYAGFLAHWLMLALARSLVSGAASAYLYEYLHRRGAGDYYQKAEGNGRAYSLIGKIVCWPAAGFLMHWHMPSVYWLTACSATVALVAALALPRLPALSRSGVARPETKDAPPVPWWASVQGAWRLLQTSRVLALIMIQGVAIFTLARICQVNLFQPILDAKHMPVTWHGMVLAAMTVCEVGGASRSHWVRRVMGDVSAVTVLTVVMAASLALIVPVTAVVTVLFLCIFALASGLSYPIQRTLLNEAITDSRYRATLLSAESIVDRAVCALVAVALGAYIARGEIDLFLIHSAVGAGVLMAIFVPLFVVARRR